jgi:hypothetical protein
VYRPPVPTWGTSGWCGPHSSSVLPAGGSSLLSDHRTVAALIAVAVTGLLAGILVAAPRISPVAAGLPSLLMSGWAVLYVVSTRHAVGLVPLKSHVYGAGSEAMVAWDPERCLRNCHGTASTWRRPKAAGEAGTCVALVPRVTMTYGLPVQQLGAPSMITVRLEY